MSELNVNDRAPDFELQGQDGKPHRLSDYRGQPVVLAFYPMDFSGVCSEEHACMVEVLGRLEKLEAQVLGISVDHRHAHAAFARQLGITYPLLADFHPKGAVGRDYGVYLEDKGFHQRWIFVIDPEGRVSFVQQNAVGEVPDLEPIVAAVKAAV
ncbi:MAG: redoxin domain-containing protein [Anaerolineae bacterium]|jgi:peroxiredoxin|nr:redoxin domain-containing protein [Ardenticatenia bacterium]MBK8539335.1 redoxin domain-containing protein [Ardenticatenia bacterium]HQZ69987.1 redoxin domain-containing protein [Anaerolineae bacterium]HRA20973.1 redoxin domain-containing protein [Anaerolineae bacterium]